MLKILIVCAVGVLILAGIIVLTLRLARKSPKTHRESREANAQPFSVEQEITYIHSQDRLDEKDY